MDPPHPPLTRYYDSEAARAGWVRGVFDRTAGDYDRIERAMAFGSGSWYRRRALADAGLRRGMRVLDVAVGTGLVAREAVRLTGDPTLVTGVDPSRGMLAAAKLPHGVRLLEGSAEDLPIAADSVDFLSMGYALRHLAGLSKAFGEFARVVKPGGRLCVLEITAPEGAAGRAMLKAYMSAWVPLLARVVGRHADTPRLMRYYWDTIEACAPPQRILRALEEAGFSQVERRLVLGIFSEYVARNPS